MFRSVILLILIICTTKTTYAYPDTFAVFFRSNDYTLTEGMQRRIDDAIYKDAISDTVSW